MRKRRFGTAKFQKSPYPDLLVFKPNQKAYSYFFAEVKRNADRLSKTQRQFFLMIEKQLKREVRIIKLEAQKSGGANQGIHANYR